MVVCVQLMMMLKRIYQTNDSHHLLLLLVLKSGLELSSVNDFKIVYD